MVLLKNNNQDFRCALLTFWRYKCAYQCCHMPFKHTFSFANVNMLIFIAAELLERMKCVMKWQSAENTLDNGFKRSFLIKIYRTIILFKYYFSGSYSIFLY